MPDSYVDRRHEHDLGVLAEKAAKVYEDVYFGKDSDNPSILTRLDRLESSMAELKQIKWLLVSSIITAIVSLVLVHLRII